MDADEEGANELEAATPEDDACFVCGSCEEDDTLIICEKCERAAHPACVGLKRIPKVGPHRPRAALSVVVSPIRAERLQSVDNWGCQQYELSFAGRLVLCGLQASQKGEGQERDCKRDCKIRWPRLPGSRAVSAGSLDKVGLQHSPKTPP